MIYGTHPNTPRTLTWRCRLLGKNHPDTLISASNLAADLRKLEQYEATRQLEEDIRARRRTAGN